MGGTMWEVTRRSGAGAVYRWGAVSPFATPQVKAQASEGEVAVARGRSFGTLRLHRLERELASLYRWGVARPPQPARDPLSLPRPRGQRFFARIRLDHRSRAPAPDGA